MEINRKIKKKGQKFQNFSQKKGEEHKKNQENRAKIPKIFSNRRANIIRKIRKKGQKFQKFSRKKGGNH